MAHTNVTEFAKQALKLAQMEHGNYVWARPNPLKRSVPTTKIMTAMVKLMMRSIVDAPFEVEKNLVILVH